MTFTDSFGPVSKATCVFFLDLIQQKENGIKLKRIHDFKTEGFKMDIKEQLWHCCYCFSFFLKRNVLPHPQTQHEESNQHQDHQSQSDDIQYYYRFSYKLRKAQRRYVLVERLDL